MLYRYGTCFRTGKITSDEQFIRELFSSDMYTKYLHLNICLYASVQSKTKVMKDSSGFLKNKEQVSRQKEERTIIL